MAYVIIALCFGMAGGIVGRVKGSSFVLWFLISFAVPVFGLLAALLSSPMPVQANAADVPLILATEPVLQESNFGFTLGAITPDSLVIEAYVDANGRVQDYRILSKPDELADLPHPVKNMLIFTTFRPATWLGTPRPGTAILSFSKISVKG